MAKCQTLVRKKHKLGHPEEPCNRVAAVRVRADPQPGWSGVHCARHSGQVVKHQSFQVEQGAIRIIVEKI
jgi:hypothetical protein